MKKIYFLLFVTATVALAADTTVADTTAQAISGIDLIKALSAMGAVIGVGIAALGSAAGIGNVTSATVSGVARNPGVASKLSTTMYIAVALIEAQIIYTLVIAFIVLYANPFL